jgi:DNA-binding FrmR family transcriptional regulator
MENHNHTHQHHHSEEHKKEVSNRLARAIGHLQKVKQMVENDDDCSDVLIQLAAVKSAINNTGKVILKDHMEHCIVHALEDGDIEMIEELNNAIDKFIK